MINYKDMLELLEDNQRVMRKECTECLKHKTIFCKYHTHIDQYLRQQLKILRSVEA